MGITGIGRVVGGGCGSTGRVGGGGGGNANCNACKIIFCSASGSARRGITNTRPSVVGKCTSTIWMADSDCNTARGVRPGADGDNFIRDVTFRP